MRHRTGLGVAHVLSGGLRVAAGAVLIGLGLVGLIAACGAPAHVGAQAGAVQAASVSEPTGTISETGSGLLYPLVRTWAAAYHQSYPGVTVTTTSTDSSTGISAASAGTADIGASDAFLSSGDLVKNPTLLNIPLAVSAQTVIYNIPGLSQATHVSLNGTILAGIYDGTITTWNDPAIKSINPDVPLPALRIVPIHRSDSSDDTLLFTSYLSAQDKQWSSETGWGMIAAWPNVAGAKAEPGSTEVTDACESTPGCVAYNGISYLSQDLAGYLGYAQLANSAGQFTLPTAAAIGDSIARVVSITPPNETISMVDGPSPTGYPIVNYEYAIVSTRQPSAGKAGEIRDFLRWMITTGNQASYLSGVGFQPLPAALATLGETQIARIGS
jgi:phosphate transport system substrate-binding protein